MEIQMKKVLGLFLLCFTLVMSSVAQAQEMPVPKSNFSVMKSLLGGKDEIAYMHPTNPDRFGKVWYRFDYDNGTLDMGNNVIRSKGTFFAVENVFCTKTEGNTFPFACFLIKEVEGQVYLVLYTNVNMELKVAAK